jgi:hypothetical protein
MTSTATSTSAITPSVLKVSLIGGFALGWANFIIDFLIGKDKDPSQLMLQVEIGLLLLAAWLVISASINTLNRLMPTISVVWLFFTGIFVGILGLFIHTFMMWLVLKHVTQSNPEWPFKAYLMAKAIPTLSVSLVVSLLTVISTRTKNKMTAMILRVLLFVIVAILIYTFL